MLSIQASTRNRIAVALVIALLAAWLHYLRAELNGGRSDFTPLWQAARLLFSGQNPYLLVGPDMTFDSQYPLFYPATAFVIASPFSLIPSFQLASSAFVFVSTFLLAFGCTKGGWKLLPIFPSVAFLTSATLGQWSILFTAMVFLPALGVIAAAKPQSALPVAGSSENRTTWIAAILGSAAVLAVSLVLLPEWPMLWWTRARESQDFVPPILRFAGFLIPIVLLRWRRSESWLVFLSACIPQTWPPYNGLILFSVARTYREASLLSLVSSASWIGFAYFADGLGDARERIMMSAVLNLGGYLPAVLMILGRPNTGPSPAWLDWISRSKSGTRSVEVVHG